MRSIIATKTIKYSPPSMLKRLSQWFEILLLLLGLNAWNTPVVADTPPMQCVAFSPYVAPFNPDWGPAPSAALIEQLLDRLLADTPFRCIMTYSVLPELAPIYAAAQVRGIKVIAILWLDDDHEVNSRSISHGIHLARTYPNTIVRLACGSEVRTRHGRRLDSEIERCLLALREAGIRQPITTIDTWWEACDATTPCQPTRFAPLMDWIGVNIFPWWENRHADQHPCTTAAQAAAFHIARLEEVHRVYPEKPIMVTEFGWPNAPEGVSEINQYTGQHCGVAGRIQQLQVVNDTFAELQRRGWSGVAFEAFAEVWKNAREGKFAAGWGLCQGVTPYTCVSGLQWRD